MHPKFRLLLLGLLIWASASSVLAQVSPPSSRPDTVATDTLSVNPVAADPVADTTVAGDTVQVDTTGADTTSATEAAPSGRDRSGDAAPTTSGARPGEAEEAGDTPAGGGAAQGERPGVDKPVTLTSRDSLVITFSETDGDLGTLYGDSEIKYEDATLTARVVEMNFDQDQVRAYGRRTAPRDSTAESTTSPPPLLQRQRVGNVIGRPQRQRETPDSLRMEPPSFKRGSEQSFTGAELSFNLATNRGRVVSARTQAEEREGFVTGQTVKVYEDSTLFVKDGSYTTCDCEPGETPSYSLRSSQMKVRGKWVYTGPIQMYLFEVPTPLWLPFGFLPNTQGRRSGPLPPQYGSEDRGLYLRDWGWYFALNDYMDLTIRAGVFSQGSYEIKPRYRYNKRYRYSGDLSVEYVRTRIGEDEDPNPTRRREGRLRWSHNQTLSPTASLSGNVNLVTSGDYLQNNAETINDAIQRTINSQIRYRKSWPEGGRSLNISVSQDQQLSTGDASVQLPNVSFSQNQFSPFKLGESLNEPRWFEKIKTSYSGRLENRYSFRRAASREEELREEGDLEAADAQWYDAIFDPDLYRRATGNNEPPLDPQLSHDVPITASYRLPRFNLNLNPRVSVSSDWFLYSKSLTQRTETIEDDPDTDVDENGTEVIRDPENVQGFYSQTEFNASLSTGTEIFGIFPVNLGAFEGLLHRFSPSVSANYQPNFNDPFWGQTAVLRDEDGNRVRDDDTNEVLLYDRRSGRVVRRGSRQLSLSFNAGNEFETKRVRVDSTGERQEKRFKFLQVNVGSAYNFAAEEFNLADFRIRSRLNISDLINLRSTITLDPYQFEQVGVTSTNEPRYRRINEYEAAATPWSPLRFTRLTLSTDLQFSSNGTSSPGTASRAELAGSVPGDPYAAYRTPTGYPRFDTQWDVEMDLTYTLSKEFVEYDPQADIAVRGGFRPTPKWRLDFRTDVDMVDTRVETASVDVSRDLGCWVLSFSWTPIGVRGFNNYGVSLRVKQGMLSNLLRLDVPRGGNTSVFRDIGSRVGQSARGAAGGNFGGI